MFHSARPPSSAPFRPLAGVVVLDLSRYLPGPFLTRILVELGAEVVKVEPPGGDSLRHLPPLIDGTGAVFRAINAGKRSVELDLKHAAGRDLLLAMVAGADVLVESFRPGVLERLGVGPDELRERNPRLIVCSISGFGRTGPHAGAAGHDLGYVARAGVLGTFGPPGGAPQVPGVPIADIAGGAWPAAVAILGALMERATTGTGRHLDLSLTRGVQALAVLDLAAAAAGAPTNRGEGLLTGGAPCYRVYGTADGRHVALAALEPEFFSAFAKAAGCTDLIGRQWATGEAGKPAIERLEALFLTRTRDEWVDLLAGVDACVEPVLSPAEVAAETGAALVLELGVGSSPVGPAPALGADGATICAALGVDESLLRAALEAGALRLPVGASP